MPAVTDRPSAVILWAVMSKSLQLGTFISSDSPTPSWNSSPTLPTIWSLRTWPRTYTHWSDYRKYLLGQVVRIRLKIEKNCRLFGDIFLQCDNGMIWSWLSHPGSRWMPNVLISKETGSEWRTILWHPHLIECMGISGLSLARGSDLRGSDVICILWRKKIIRKIFFKFSQGSCPLWPLLAIFVSRFF